MDGQGKRVKLCFLGGDEGGVLSSVLLPLVVVVVLS